ncbi:MAG: helix-turn-helix domain-containing protein [Actinomycetes bacterium]
MHGNPSAPANRPVAQANVGLEADDRLAYSVNEAAQRLGVGPMTLYREIAEGKLPAIRIRDRILVPKVVLERLVQEAMSRARWDWESHVGGWLGCSMTAGHRCRLEATGRRTPRRSPARATSS